MPGPPTGEQRPPVGPAARLSTSTTRPLQPAPSGAHSRITQHRVPSPGPAGGAAPPGPARPDSGHSVITSQTPSETTGSRTTGTHCGYMTLRYLRCPSSPGETHVPVLKSPRPQAEEPGRSPGTGLHTARPSVPLGGPRMLFHSEQGQGSGVSSATQGHGA